MSGGRPWRQFMPEVLRVIRSNHLCQLREVWNPMDPLRFLDNSFLNFECYFTINVLLLKSDILHNSTRSNYEDIRFLETVPTFWGFSFLVESPFYKLFCGVERNTKAILNSENVMTNKPATRSEFDCSFVLVRLELISIVLFFLLIKFYIAFHSTHFEFIHRCSFKLPIPMQCGLCDITIRIIVSACLSYLVSLHLLASGLAWLYRVLVGLQHPSIHVSIWNEGGRREMEGRLDNRRRVDDVDRHPQSSIYLLTNRGEICWRWWWWWYGLRTFVSMIMNQTNFRC